MWLLRRFHFTQRRGHRLLCVNARQQGQSLIFSAPTNGPYNSGQVDLLPLELFYKLLSIARVFEVDHGKTPMVAHLLIGDTPLVSYGHVQEVVELMKARIVQAQCFLEKRRKILCICTVGNGFDIHRGSRFRGAGSERRPFVSGEAVGLQSPLRAARCFAIRRRDGQRRSCR